MTFDGQESFIPNLKSSSIQIPAVPTFGDPHPLSFDDTESQASEARFGIAVEVTVAVGSPIIYY